MNKEQLLTSLEGFAHPSVISAMSRVPREMFLPDLLQSRAYDDTPLPIGRGQTISAPHMVAIMCTILDLQPGMNVLEVGGGSGYHAAVMAELVRPGGWVYSVERIAELAEEARSNLARAGVENVTVIHSDGSLGLPEHAPYDRISVAATAPSIPEPLKQQLKSGGKMVLPVGRDSQELYLVTRKNGFSVERKMGVIFVPLIGQEGFKERD
ncbi:MAG: protein-L-isoaspartate(D-aspartate) O-methyltransferase [Methanosaeta sp. NSM2]|nr:protein-L-isoaspartate(D-aspartate) O-methyltransferase [Methanothrix sp.]OYV14437.1 MAG: protein-L-isoaspartate(D-aspartate) O-methyltransferase [Methanosaeta sp. NSM2]